MRPRIIFAECAVSTLRSATRPIGAIQCCGEWLARHMNPFDDKIKRSFEAGLAVGRTVAHFAGRPIGASVDWAAMWAQAADVVESLVTDYCREFDDRLSCLAERLSEAGALNCVRGKHSVTCSLPNGSSSFIRLEPMRPYLCVRASYDNGLMVDFRRLGYMIIEHPQFPTVAYQRRWFGYRPANKVKSVSKQLGVLEKVILDFSYQIGQRVFLAENMYANAGIRQ